MIEWNAKGITRAQADGRYVKRFVGSALAADTGIIAGEPTLFNPSGPVMGGLPLNTVAAAFNPGDGGRFGTRLRVVRFGATNAGAQVQGVFARGTPDAPTAVQSGDGLLALGGQGFDGSDFNQQASVRIVATEAWTSSARGAEVQIAATASGSTTQQGVINFRRASAATAAEMVSGSGTLRLIPLASATLRNPSNTADLIEWNATGLGFFGTAPIAKPTVTGSRSGNAALASLCAQLAALGLITDSTTA